MFIPHKENQQQFITQHDKQLAQVPAEVRKKIQNYSFLLTDRIGKGYSSVVYKGINDLTGAQVAIKVIELKSLRDQTSKSMLQTEIECFKETRHPSLLSYENSFFTVNNCYIITEYCSGGDLSKLIKEKGSFSQEEAGGLFLQIFQGYEHFHAAGFIHRDLKPANIFVTAEGALKIADFGFSKRRSLVERDNYNVGTPIYMPKESLTANVYNEKTDVWAMGITLYQMLFGSVPFRGKTEHQLRVEIEKGLLVFPDSKPISQQLKNFISGCLHSDSFRRFSLRQMHRHPWIQKQLKKEGTRSPEKQKSGEKWAKPEHQEKEMRISLPNEGVTHNKSKDYFEKPALLDNRRSISSMQKLKLCHPKKGSQLNLPPSASLPRQPILNRSVPAINITMPIRNDESAPKDHSAFTCANNKHHRDSLQNKENISYQNKQNLQSNHASASISISTLPSLNNLKDYPTKAQDVNRTKTGIQKIVSLINYFRLLFKIAEKVAQTAQEVLDGQIKCQLAKLNATVLNDFRCNFQMHLESLNSKNNLFGLNSIFWGQFVGSERWTMYSFVIKRYQLKYEAVFKSGETKGETINWRKHFLEFYGRMKELEATKIFLVKERYLLCELAYLLETLVEMDELVLEKGWEDFTQRYSSTEEFVPEGFSISMANYYEVEEKVRNRYTSLRLRQ